MADHGAKTTLRFNFVCEKCAESGRVTALAGCQSATAPILRLGCQPSGCHTCADRRALNVLGQIGRGAIKLSKAALTGER